MCKASNVFERLYNETHFSNIDAISYIIFEFQNDLKHNHTYIESFELDLRM